MAWLPEKRSMSEPRDLILLTKAEKALLEATSLDEVRDLRDKAAAVKAYAKKAQLGQKAVIHASVIKLRAERRIGEILQAVELADSAPGNQYTGRLEPSADSTGPVFLRDLGITKADSSRSQRIADLPAELFEQYLAANTEANREPTMAGLLRLGRQPQHGRDSVLFPHAGLSEAAPSLEELIQVGARFATIYASPPWPPAAEHPDTVKLSVKRIAAERIPELCEKEAHLHMWARNSTLSAALNVMKAWGFTYHSCLVCLKPTMGNGPYWRESHEFLLLGVRGKLLFADGNQPSWIECEWPEDGSKPESIRQLVEMVSPGPYLDIFGDSKQPNAAWVTCQIPSTMTPDRYGGTNDTETPDS
jgi:N6-adenosine-specific RNA methylase IME4